MWCVRDEASYNTEVRPQNFRNECKGKILQKIQQLRNVIIIFWVKTKSKIKYEIIQGRSIVIFYRQPDLPEALYFIYV